jgi:hypothetical protein
MNFSFFKNKINFLPERRQSGFAVMTSVVFFLFISLAITAGLVSPTVRELKIATDLLHSKQSNALSESGIEDAYFRLKTGKNIDSSEVITLNGNTATTTITDAYNEKKITALGDISSKHRKNEVVLNAGTGVSFSYGVQVGTGGITMGNNSVINGSVYSNGSITGSGTVTGTALAANAPALTAVQTNDTTPPAYNVIFGNTNGTQDFAQSFQLSETGQINKVELYLKKISTPGNLTVRIVNNSGSNPGTTTLASGSLSASLVSTTYGWVNVPLSSNPELTAGTTYWLVIDGATNSSRYYYIGANDNGYASGIGKVGQQGGAWSNTSPSGLDGFFRVYLGGQTGLISGINVGADAYAHTVNSSTITGALYCQTGSGNNKSCNTSLADPTQIAMPVSDQNILDWQAEGESGGTYSGNYVVDGTTASLGPKKITGNLSVTNNASLTVTGTLWVQGNVDISNNANVRLSSDYGTSEGVIVADGIVNIGNNAVFAGSGSAGSYLMVLSTSSSTSAITLSNNGGAVILYAANGTVNLSNNAGAKALNGKFINLSNNVVITYDSGLVNSNFTNGPSGGWDVQSWKEVE